MDGVCPYSAKLLLKFVSPALPFQFARTGPLWQIEFGGCAQRALTFQILAAAKEYLKEQPDDSVKVLSDLEAHQYIRVTATAPPQQPQKGPADIDGVGVVERARAHLPKAPGQSPPQNFTEPTPITSLELSGAQSGHILTNTR